MRRHGSLSLALGSRLLGLRVLGLQVLGLQVLGLGLLVMMLSGCLPGDERPEPGRLRLKVRRSAQAADGFTTDDGWAISFERFVAGIGASRLTGDDCVDYSVSVYDRLFDFAVADTSNLVLHYGLGVCRIPFVLTPPSPEALLMAGVSEADREMMGLDIDDVENIGNLDPLEALIESQGQAPIALIVKGSASREGVTKSFEWHIRQRHSVNRCNAPGDPLTVANAFDLQGGDRLFEYLLIRPQELFRTGPSDNAAITFQRFADADTDGDGSISLQELGAVPVPEALFDDFPYDPPYDFPPELEALLPDPFPQPTLRTLMHDVLSSRVILFEGAGECSVNEITYTLW